jgi:hypothetical protein
MDRAEADRILSALGKRVFLLHDVHEPQPIVFQTRWALSYLRGPLSKEHIRSLMEEARNARGGPARPGGEVAPRGPMKGEPASAGSSGRPVIPPGIDQYFLPVPAGDHGRDARTYAPVVVGAARVTFTDARLKVDITRDAVYATPVSDGAVAVDWQEATELAATAEDLRDQPERSEASFLEVPSAAQQPKNYAAWQKAFGQWLSRTQRIELLRHPATKLTSFPGEAERDFRARVQDALRERRDADVEAVRKKFAARRETLAERIRKAQGTVGREQQQASQQKTQTFLSIGAAAVGALLGRRILSTGTLGRATTAARGVGRTMKEADDVARASENVAALRAQMEAFDQSVVDETASIAAAYDLPVELERIAVTPKRGQVQVLFVALGWEPR